MADYSTLYKEALSGLKSGGRELESELADIEAGKKSAIAGGQQSLIGSGLGGTTVMGAVPLAAEKTAGRARLGARGRAETRYWSALMSFAGLAESARQAELDRRSTRQNMLLQSRLDQPPKPGTAASPYDVFGAYKEGRGPSGTGGTGGTGNAQQFPSLYGTSGGGSLPSAPNLMGGDTGDTGGYNVPREYDPSMVGKSLWGQQGSQVSTMSGQVPTLEQGTQQAVAAGLPQSAQSGTTSKTITNARTGQTKTVQVSADALGSGPGGFKDEKTYLAHVPSGYRLA